MPPNTLLLDLGNVLAFHDNSLLFRRFAERASRPTPQIEDSFWRRINTGALSGDSLRIEVNTRLGTTLDAPDFHALWNCHFSLNASLFPHLERLATTHKLVLVSNTNAPHYEFLKPQLPILRRFHTLIASHEVGLAKPDPAFFRLALERAGSAPHEAVYWDDLPDYVDAARALGITSRVFTTTDAFVADLEALGLAA